MPKAGPKQRTTPTVYEKARRHLARHDPVLKGLIRAVGPCTLWHNPNRFAALVRSIIAQQISTKAAAAISGRLEQALAPAVVSAAGILALPGEQLRAADGQDRFAPDRDGLAQG